MANLRKMCGALVLAAMVAGAAQAQDKLEVKMTGRAIFDAATYGTDDDYKDANDGESLTSGVHVFDLRLGLKATYGNWLLRSEVALKDNKVSMKDVFLQYAFQENNFLRAGHYTVPFGLSSAYGSADKEFMDEPSANVFQPSRRIGVMHTIYNKPLWLQYGVFADNSALTKPTDESGPQGWMAAGRFVYRPLLGTDYALHLGISGVHERAEATSKDSHRAIKYNKGFMTVVDKTDAVGVNIYDARWENKFTVELAGIWRNFQIGSQYYWSHIGRERYADGKASFNSNGFYVSARGIIVNPEYYTYNMGGAGIKHPSHKNLELAIGYGFLDLNDDDAIGLGGIGTGIYGGKMQHYNMGLSFFLNKYITFRAEYGHFTVKYPSTSYQDVDMLQARVQYLF